MVTNRGFCYTRWHCLLHACTLANNGKEAIKIRCCSPLGWGRGGGLNGSLKDELPGTFYSLNLVHPEGPWSGAKPPCSNLCSIYNYIERGDRE